MEWLQSGGDVVAKIGTFFTMFGEETILVALLTYFYWCRDKRAGRTLGMGLIAALISGSMIKNIVLRRRPYFDHDSIQCLKKVDAKADLYDIAAQGYSCPSLHSSNAAVLFGTFGLWLRRNWAYAIAILLPLCVGISRMILGVHYPTDVILGWVLGFVMLQLVLLLQRKISNQLTIFIIYALVGLPGWFFCHSSDFFDSYGLMIGMLLGFFVEDKLVHFENTKDLLQTVLRMAFGIGLFLGVSSGIKLAIPEEIRNADNLLGHLIHCVRYAAAAFLAIGIYPMSFPYMARIGSAKTDVKA